jgi:hypothetical protein
VNRIPASLPAPALALALALAACGSSSSNDPPGRTVIATGTAGAYSVTLLADAPLATGMNPIYVQLRNASGALVTDSTVTVSPLMAMTGMTHGCPVGPIAVGASGDYQGYVVFQMASSATDTWTAKVTVTPPPGGTAADVTLPITVAANTTTGGARTFTLGTGTMAERYVVSMNATATQMVGPNPITVTVYRSTDMSMTFTPVNDATVTVDPQMPSMGHGSSGSVNPTFVASGAYQGQLNYSMPGAWETTVTVNRPGFAAPQSVKINTSF